MPSETTPPTAASLWIGDALGWLEYGCLKSFEAAGQPIILFSYAPINNVPDNVELRDAGEIWTPSKDVFEKTAPSYIADIFRIHMISQTDFFWVDTDIILKKPIFPNEYGFIAGYTPWHGEINNCILKLPTESQTFRQFFETIENPEIVPKWIRPALQQRLQKLPIDEREVARYHTLRTILGPKALTHIMKKTGEIAHAAEPDVLSPVPWQFVDVLFNPYGGWEGWFSEDTCAVHLWSNMLRQHRKMPVHPDSFIGRTFADLGVETP